MSDRTIRPKTKSLRQNRMGRVAGGDMKRGLIALAVLALGAGLFSGCVKKGEAPCQPAQPKGPGRGAVGKSYTFKASTVDPDGDSVQYQFDWGKGTSSRWTLLYSSGTIAYYPHTWEAPGKFEVRVRAKDAGGLETDWSYPRSITIADYPYKCIDSLEVGDWLGDIVVLPSGEYLYVEVDSGLVVLRTDVNSVVATISTGWVADIVASATGDYVYATQDDSARVLAIRTADNSVVRTADIGGTPSGIAVLPNGDYIYVANPEDDSVVVMSASDFTIVASVSVGQGPHRLAVHPDGGCVYVANRDGNSVSVIRTSDNSVVAEVPVGEYPRDLVCTPDGQYVYVTNSSDGTVSVIRTSDNSVATTIDLETTPLWALELLPGGKYLYVHAANLGELLVIRTSDNLIVDRLKPCVPRFVIEAHPDGSKIYVPSLGLSEPNYVAVLALE